MLPATQIPWCLVFTASCLSVALSYPEVVVPNLGKIVGKTVIFQDIAIDTFQGIPYAQPPIGDLRFRKTQPVKEWKGLLQADRMQPACIQHSSNPFPWLDDLPGQSMDCLYLNIWAGPTAAPKDPKPVMLWIHGGGFRIGSSRVDYYDGGALAALGGVLVVSFNYRLGVEGFLYAEREEAPGNMGLHDILEALKWTRAHISHFGGDPDSITIFGQSSGAIAIGMLLVSPLAKGLVARAVLQSGSAANMDGDDNGRDLALSEGIAREADCTGQGTLEANPGGVVDCLRGKDPLLLAQSVYKVSDNPQRGLYPRYGDELLPANAREAILEGNFHPLDVLIGNVKDEGTIMVTKANKDIFGFFGDKENGVNRTFGEYLMRKGFKSFEDGDAVVEHYLGPLWEEDRERVLDQVQTAFGDVSRVCPSVYFAESAAAKGKKVYYYNFNHRPSGSPWAPWMGTTHFEETPFVFGYPLRYPEQFTKSEQELSRRIITIWTDFAKYGTLNSWPLYSKNQPYYKTLDTDDERIETGPHLRNCNFFRPYFGL